MKKKTFVYISVITTAYTLQSPKYKIAQFIDHWFVFEKSLEYMPTHISHSFGNSFLQISDKHVYSFCCSRRVDKIYTVLWPQMELL